MRQSPCRLGAVSFVGWGPGRNRGFLEGLAGQQPGDSATGFLHAGRVFYQGKPDVAFAFRAKSAARSHTHVGLFNQPVSGVERAGSAPA
jgi:hypothetical protein